MKMFFEMLHKKKENGVRWVNTRMRRRPEKHSSIPTDANKAAHVGQGGAKPNRQEKGSGVSCAHVVLTE